MSLEDLQKISTTKHVLQLYNIFYKTEKSKNYIKSCMFNLLFLQTIELLLRTFTRNKKEAI